MTSSGDVTCCCLQRNYACRYAGIHDPLKNRTKSHLAVGVRVTAVWLVSVVIGSPLTVLGAVRPEQILSEDRQCAIFNAYYVVYGRFLQ